MKKGTGSSTTPTNTSAPTATTTHTVGGKDGASKCSEAEVAPSTNMASAGLPKSESAHIMASTTLHESEGARTLASASIPEGRSRHGRSITSSGDSQRILSATQHLLLHCSNTTAERSNVDVQDETDPNKA